MRQSSCRNSAPSSQLTSAAALRLNLRERLILSDTHQGDLIGLERRDLTVVLRGWCTAWKQASTERINSVEAGIGCIRIRRRAQPASVLQRVLAEGQVSYVLQFVAVLSVAAVPAGVAPRGKCAWNGNRRQGAHRILVGNVVDVLKSRFVNRGATQGLGVRDLQRVFCAQTIVSLRGEREGAHAVVVVRVAEILITRAERVALAHLEVKPWAQVGAPLGMGDGIAEGKNRKGNGIDNLRANDGEVIDVAPLDVEEKRSFLAQRAAKVRAVLRGLVARRIRAGGQAFERAARVQR